MVAALSIYCDLLAEPGVLTPGYFHYGSELRLVMAASRRLVEKMVLLDTRQSESDSNRALVGSAAIPLAGTIFGAGSQVLASHVSASHRSGDEDSSSGSMPDELNGNFPIDNLAEELEANRNLLDALAGLSITVTLDAECGQLPVRMTGEDLTRILVNLVKNAAETIHKVGTIHIALREGRQTQDDPASSVRLTIEDNGPGIAPELLEKIFEAGFSTRPTGSAANRSGDRSSEHGWATAHRGLGLSITRSMVEAAGGQVTATNCSRGGARFEIELPVRTR